MIATIFTMMLWSPRVGSPRPVPSLAATVFAPPGSTGSIPVYGVQGTSPGSIETRPTPMPDPSPDKATNMHPPDAVAPPDPSILRSVVVYSPACASKSNCAGAPVCVPPAYPANPFFRDVENDIYTPDGPTVCIGNGPPTPPAPDDDTLSTAAATEYKTVDLPAATLAISPQPKTLVNLPTILSAGSNQQAFTKAVTVDGVTCTFVITPHFHWDLVGIPPIDTDDPGTPYDGTDPAKYPKHYVTGTWATTGVRRITLTVSWPAVVTRDDNGDTLTAPPAIERTATTTTDVRQARSELTGNS